MANRADFAPELGALKSLRPFVFWAQTTLPTVFDDSLSYYEVLTKLCKMVNTLLENEDTNAENITALAEAYQELEDFTNNYFENLDVTQEINDKLDELVADGTIGGYVVDRATTLVNNYLYGEDGESGKNKEIEDMISEAQTDIETALGNFATRSNQAVTTFELNSAASIRTFEDRVDDELAGVSTIVEDWMDANFTNPSSVVIDDTLTVKDAAAEAYATGKLMDDAENMILATAYWQDYVIDSVSGSFILADVAGGSNPAVGTGAPAKTLYIANVTPGETYIVSGVASSYSTTRYTPAYALGNLTYDASDNPYYEFYDVYPRGWDESQDPGTVYQYVRNQVVRIPTGTTPSVTHLFIVGDSRVPITVRCSRLNVRTDTALTSESLPAQGKATGDALDTKIPWPVTGGSKDVGTSGKRLASNGDGTTSWVDEGGDYDEEIENLQNDVVDLKSAIRFINTEHIAIESGTFKEANGTEKTANENRARNVTPVSVDNFTALAMPSGYSMWVYLLNEKFELISTTREWRKYVTKHDIKNAHYINFVIRNNATPSSPITEEIETIESGIEFLTLNEFNNESLSNLSSKIRDSICFKKSPDITITNRALHYDGTSSILAGFNLYKYAVTPGELVWIVANVDNTAVWQGVWQWQSSESTPAVNPTVVGFTKTSGINAVVEVPDGVSYLVVCGAATNELTGIYEFLDNLDESTDIVKKYVNAGTLMDRKSVQKNADACFVFFSDIHAGATNYSRIIEFCNSIGTGSVDAIINGGDVVQSTLGESVEWYDSKTEETSIDVLTCVGNHDVWESLWNTGNPVTIYNKFTAPVISRVHDVVQPSGAAANGLNYYYKDYGNVRVIVLAAMYYTAQDQMLWTSAQKNWLDGALADAKTNGKSVICVNHAPYMKSKAVIDKELPLNSWRDYPTGSIFDGICVAQEAVDSVHAFIADGGEFVCWLTGHTHQDMVMTERDYADQFMINIASAKYIYHTDGFSPESNELSATAYDCFDYVGVDTTNKMVKVWRIGFNEDASMKVRNRFSYDYANRKILTYS